MQFQVGHLPLCELNGNNLRNGFADENRLVRLRKFCH